MRSEQRHGQPYTLRNGQRLQQRHQFQRPVNRSRIHAAVQPDLPVIAGDLLRTLTPQVPITTNFVLGSWVPVDHRRWADEVDLVAIDHYPSSAEPLRAEQETAFAADLARGWARGGPWLLMEQAPNLIYTGNRMVAKPASQ